MARSAVAVVGDIAADQWGLLTTAQARHHGVGRTEINRMANQGVIHRIAHGVYATPAADADPLVDLRAAWLNLDPATPAYARLDDPATGVVSHDSAAHLHRLGDLTADIHHFTLPRRYQTRRPDVRAHRAELTAADITLVDGLPTTTIPRTISDLITAGHDTDHIAEIVRQAIWEERTTIAELGNVLREQHRDRADDLLDELVHAAGIDPAQLLQNLLNVPAVSIAVNAAALQRFQDIARTVLPDDLAQKALINALAPLREVSEASRTYLNALVMPQALSDSIRAMLKSIAAPNAETLRALTASPALDLINGQKYAQMLRQYTTPNLPRTPLPALSPASADDHDDPRDDHDDPDDKVHG